MWWKLILAKDSFEKFHNSEESERTLTVIEGFFFTISGLIFLMTIKMLINKKKYDPEDDGMALMFLILYSIYMGMLSSCFICQIVFF